ncbi:MAG: RNA pseudouridine synthase [Desulfobulbaceae bacterium]|nr:MAG: RNA pseudouridine synthase [Desulfobulbaceae bacterium]
MTKPPAPHLDIIHHDPHLVVINKPGGLLAVPGRGPDKQDCVVNRLKALVSPCLDQPAVHRLDMATSGLMVLALTRHAHAALSRQFAERLVVKKYMALLAGPVSQTSGEIRLAFRLDPDNRPRQIYDPHQGKTGITKWRLLRADEQRSRVEFTPITGRTHQLRVHAAHPLGLGRPIIGDPLYGQGREGDQLMLHATEITFFHPVTGRRSFFSSPPPF